MANRNATLALMFAVLTPPLGIALGGWAVVTVDDVPTHLVAGQKTPIAFKVRQHGFNFLSDLSPSVQLKSGSQEVTVAAAPVGDPGHYQATVTPPSTGTWTVTVQSGFGNSKTTLLPLRAIAANAPAPREVADADRGRQLFYGKGCVTCHVRGGDGESGFKTGPTLTGKRYPVDYVATFLDDPDKSPLSKSNTGQFVKMPKLGLSQREITALVAFLNTTEVASTPER
jgi:mono/diheme cytochrome c family protein